MPISLQCPECDKTLRVADEKRGKRIKCPDCSAVVTIPDDEEELEAEPEPARRSKKPAKRPGKRSQGKSAGISPLVWVGIGGVAVIAVGLLFWSMMPRGGAGASAESVAADRDRLKKLTLAMHNYHDINQQFPISDRPGHFDQNVISGQPANFAPDGRPYLSWRVHLLPFLSHVDLYKQFHMNEPWDSPHNKKLLDQMPDEFRSGNDQGPNTRMLTLTGPHGLFFQRKVGMRDITDGTSNTALIVQVGPDKAVPWTKPDDVVADAANPLAPFGKIGKSFLCAMADGMILEFDSTIDPKTMAAIATPKGGEVINARTLAIQQPTPPKATNP